jgi:hypothetical protein
VIARAMLARISSLFVYRGSLAVGAVVLVAAAKFGVRIGSKHTKWGARYLLCERLACIAVTRVETPEIEPAAILEKSSRVWRGSLLLGSAKLAK